MVGWPPCRVDRRKPRFGLPTDSAELRLPFWPQTASKNFSPPNGGEFGPQNVLINAVFLVYFRSLAPQAEKMLFCYLSVQFPVDFLISLELKNEDETIMQ